MMVFLIKFDSEQKFYLGYSITSREFKNKIKFQNFNSKLTKQIVVGYKRFQNRNLTQKLWYFGKLVAEER